MVPMSTATTDLCDAHPEVQVCDPILIDFGGRRAFHGPIATLKVFEDNGPVRAALEARGDGRVLVVDGGGSLRCALVGGLLGRLAVERGWAGIVVHGCIRDRHELAQFDLGVKALAAHPRKSEKGVHGGHAGRIVRFAGASFRPGAWLYSDADGVIVAEHAIHQ
jgi:regulator of ribonuclease activity A